MGPIENVTLIMEVSVIKVYQIFVSVASTQGLSWCALPPKRLIKSIAQEY